MIQTTTVNMIGPTHCKYRLHGKNLVELRRARLRLIAGSLGLSQDGSKNDLLKSLIGKFNAMGAETEISEIGAKPKKKAKKTK